MVYFWLCWFPSKYLCRNMYHHSRLNQHADEQCKPVSMMCARVAELTSLFLNNLGAFNKTISILGEWKIVLSRSTYIKLIMLRIQPSKIEFIGDYTVGSKIRQYKGSRLNSVIFVRPMRTSFARKSSRFQSDYM